MPFILFIFGLIGAAVLFLGLMGWGLGALIKESTPEAKKQREDEAFARGKQICYNMIVGDARDGRLHWVMFECDNAANNIAHYKKYGLYEFALSELKKWEDYHKAQQAQQVDIAKYNALLEEEARVDLEMRKLKLEEKTGEKINLDLKTGGGQYEDAVKRREARRQLQGKEKRVELETKKADLKSKEIDKEKKIILEAASQLTRAQLHSNPEIMKNLKITGLLEEAEKAAEEHERKLEQNKGSLNVRG